MPSRREAARALAVAPDAGPEVVRRAFRRRAALDHPDRGGDPARFVRLVEARDQLLDDARPRRTRATASAAPPQGQLVDRILALLLRRVTAWEHRRRFATRDRNRVS